MPSEQHPLQTTYQRKRWKHFVRYLALLLVLFADSGFVVPLVRIYTLPHADITPALILKQCFAYLLFIFCNVAIIPSIVMEADKVEVTDDGLIIHNLLFRRNLRWSDIRSVDVPWYLKFAILKTSGLFQLINKHDMPDFNHLIQTIQTKTEQSPK
jgi:Bacterial PH domain